MRRHVETILARATGTALVGALVTVYETGTVIKATLYGANEAILANEIANPLTSDAFGEVAFYVEDGVYDLRIDHGSQPTRTIAGVQIYDLPAFLNLISAKGPLALLDGIADQLPYFNGISTAGKTPITAFARSLLATTTSAEALALVQTDAQAIADQSIAARDLSQLYRDQAQAAAGLAGTYGNMPVYRSWALLSAVVGAANNMATILVDGGTHVDPVVGGNVSNSGIFSYSTGPAGWQRIGETVAGQALISAVRASNFAPFSTRAQLVAATQMLNGDRTTVVNDAGTHVAVAGEFALGGAAAVVGAAIPNNGRYQYNGAAWLRIGDLDSQTASLNGAAQVALATEWSSKAEDAAITGSPGQYSALHHSAKANAQRVLAETAAGNSATAAARQVNRARFGSIMFPFENGLSTIATENGDFRLPNFRLQAASGGMGGVAGTTAFWAQPSAIMALVDVGLETNGALNFSPYVFGTASNLTLARTVALKWDAGFHATPSQRRRFTLYVKGESGDGGWTMQSPQIPDTVPGPFALYGYHDGANGYLHVLDIPTMTWYDGTAVAKPGVWNGVLFFTNDLAIGSVGSATFPTDNSAAYQGSAQWRTAIGDILFCNATLSKANVESIVNGAAVVATATGAGATDYLHIPLTDGTGLQQLSVVSTRTGMAAGLTQNGVVFPGPDLKRQAAGTYLTIDRLKWPALFVREDGADSVMAQLTGKIGGLTGSMSVRIVRTADGSLIRDWAPVLFTTSAGSWSAELNIPTPINDGFQIQARMSSSPTVIASTHGRCYAGPAVMISGQSETAMSCLDGFSSFGLNGTNNVQARGRTDTVFWLNRGAGSADPLDFFHIRRALRRGGIVGDNAMTIANEIRRRTQEPVFLIFNAISGTSFLDVMDDAIAGRTWEDYTGRAGLVQNRGRRGELIVTGDVIGGWEAFFGSTANVMAGAYKPWFTGIASKAAGATDSSGISQGFLNHWRFDGTFSMNSRQVILPCNRADGTWGTDATATDASGEANQRDQFRNYAHILGFEIAPETVTHKLQGENAAGGIPSGNVTHAEVGGDWEGTVEMGQVFAEAILMAIGKGRYPGPVFFEAIRAGTANNKVIVTAGNPRPYPGEGLAEAATGYSTASQRARNPSPVRLRTKKTGGDPGAAFEARKNGGAWSKANVTSGTIINGREVELTLAFTYVGGDTIDIRYLPGAPGKYSNATITQEAWRSGTLFFTGEVYAAAAPEKLGWAVAGSNQLITLAA